MFGGTYFFTFTSKVKSVTSLIRLKPFDNATEDGRSKERLRRVYIASLMSVVARGISILTAIVSVPLTINYLGDERYGLWMTISSILAFLSVADLGIGLGLQNAVANSHGKDDQNTATVSISSTFFILTFIALFFLIIFFFLYPLIPWHAVYNISSSMAKDEAGPATAMLIFITIINIPISIVQRTQLAYQEGFKNQIWAIIGSFLGFLGLLIAIYFKVGLTFLVLAIIGGPTIAKIINWIREFVFIKPWLLPKWKYFNWITGKHIFQAGIMFFILQIFALIGNSSDNFIIAQVEGISNVAVYSIVQKLFSLCLIAQYFTQFLWPAFTEAMAREEYVWVKKMLTKTLAIGLIVGFVIGTPLLIFGKDIIFYWAGESMVPSTPLLFGFFLWVFYAAYGGSLSTFINNGELLKKQTFLHVLASIIVLIIKIVFIKKIGIEGVIFATVIGYTLFSLIPLTVMAYANLNKKIREQKEII
jgi:O-antigen/teichoic acid export membrane protein